MSEPVAFDTTMMARALALAARGLMSTDPNPRVGCVLVRDGQVVGEGWHERAGEAHAEVMALRAAGEQARGATAYVTLEPCNHTGRTPPCVDALLAAGIARVVYAHDDPFASSRGAGAQRLRAGGVLVESGCLAAEARALNPGFCKRLERGLPWVRVKLGASLDGRTALADGTSRWITGREARADAQLYRARSSAVLSGSGTVRIDDPAMNVRVPGAERQPLRVVLDSALRVAPGSRVFEREGPSVIFTASTDPALRAPFEQLGVRIELTPRTATGLDLSFVLRQLAAWQMNEVWVEAGARLAGAFVAAGLVDELIVYVAPVLLGSQALPLACIPDPPTLELAPRFRYSDVRQIGGDIRLTAVPVGAD